MKTAKRLHEAEALRIVIKYGHCPDTVLFNKLNECCNVDESVTDLLDVMQADSVIRIRG